MLAALDARRPRLVRLRLPGRSLLGHPRVIALPHLGASTREAEDNCAVMVADQLREYLEHGNVVNAVNFPAVAMARESAYRVAIANANVPNMLGQISTAMAHAGLNIHNMVNKSRGEMAYTLVDVDSAGRRRGARGHPRDRRRAVGALPAAGRIAPGGGRGFGAGAHGPAGPSAQWAGHTEEHRHGRFEADPDRPRPPLRRTHRARPTPLRAHPQGLQDARRQVGHVLLAARARQAVPRRARACRCRCASCSSRCCAIATARRSPPSTWPQLANWQPQAPRTEEIPFVVARVVLQDFTGVPLLADLAAMRSVAADMGQDPKTHRAAGAGGPGGRPLGDGRLLRQPDALDLNMKLEFKRNHERYQFMKWGMQAFDTFRVVPPGFGIVHQVNLEYLARGVHSRRRGGRSVYYPDTLVGTDSHTTMINGIGVVGWGVGGIEAEAAMLGQPVYFLTPDVVGFEFTGRLREGVTATDLVLTVTEILRREKVVGKFVEFFGEGAAGLPVPDRATLGNMAPEYGATMGFFPVDAKTIDYFRGTGRSQAEIEALQAYFEAQGMFGVPRAGRGRLFAGRHARPRQRGAEPGRARSARRTASSSARSRSSSPRSTASRRPRTASTSRPRSC